MTVPAEKPKLSSVSVIIPCLNDGPSLGPVLEALAKQRYPADAMEVLVVDNGSVDDSAKIAESYNVRLLQEPVRSSYLARNRGIKAASGEMLLFLDADTVPCPEWVDEMVSCSKSHGTSLVGGRIESQVCRQSLGSMLLAITRSAAHRREMVEKQGRLSGGNMLVPRELFDRYGLFLPVRSGGDAEFAERANPEKQPIPYAEKAVVTHQCRISTSAYLYRCFRIARGQAQTRGDKSVVRLPLPWRPGWRRAVALGREIAAYLDTHASSGIRKPWLLAPRLLVVLWMDRWFFFAGNLVGRRTAMGDAHG